MDAETRQLLSSSLTKLFGEPSDRSLTDRLGDLGWDEVVNEDESAALSVLFETKGEMAASGDALGPCLSRAISTSLGDPDLTSAVIVLPASMDPIHPSSYASNGSVSVSGLTLGPLIRGAQLVVPIGLPSGRFCLGLSTSDTAWSAEPVEATDPDFGLRQLNVTVPASQIELVDADRSAAAWESAVALGRWALAAEMVGLGRRVITDAVTYSGQRKQYGRAIGTFQALQHRLAGAHASVVGAANVVTEAANSRSPWVALVAKALAGRASETACTQAQQVYGAIGFTWEHGFHGYLRRAFLLDWLLGDWRGLEVQIGAQLQTSGEVPRIGML
jgi:hypothetical protein